MASSEKVRRGGNIGSLARPTKVRKSNLSCEAKLPFAMGF